MDPFLINPWKSYIYAQYSNSSSRALNVWKGGLSFVSVILYLKMKLIWFIINRLQLYIVVNSYKGCLMIKLRYLSSILPISIKFASRDILLTVFHKFTSPAGW